MRKKNFQEVIGFKDTRLIAWGIPVAGILVFLLLFNAQLLEIGPSPYFLVCLLMSFVYTSGFWFSMRATYKYVRQLYPESEHIRQRIFLALASFLFVYFVVDKLLNRFFVYVVPEHPDEINHVMKFVTSLILCSLVIAIYEASAFYVQLRDTRREKVELEAIYTRSQLESLKNQVNPHFLFNSLNTLIAVIPENPDVAVRFVQHLSKVYRYILEIRDKKMISLSDELEFLDAFIFLHKERFGESLKVKIHPFDGCQHCSIAPLSLQILFENAIKHNIISRDKPLSIDVFVRQGPEPVLIMSNNLQRKKQVQDSTGFGLQNIRERYRMLTERGVFIKTSDDTFSVELPLLNI